MLLINMFFFARLWCASRQHGGREEKRIHVFIIIIISSNNYNNNTLTDTASFPASRQENEL